MVSESMAWSWRGLWNSWNDDAGLKRAGATQLVGHSISLCGGRVHRTTHILDMLLGERMLETSAYYSLALYVSSTAIGWHATACFLLR